MKKIGLIALILIIFVAAAFSVTALTSKKKTPTAKHTAPTQHFNQYPQTADTKKKDQQIVDNMKQMLTIIVNYYSVNHKKFPSNDAKGWQQIIDEVPTTSVFINPYTNAFFGPSYGADPDYGEVQWAADTTCNNSNGFTGNVYRSFALRSRTVAGVRCVSIGIQNTTD